ncbi:MAG: glycosyltransferase family 4 protein [Ilumatobacteraceae bacterium]
MSVEPRVRVAFIMEQHVGLRTYTANLRRFADVDERIEASWTFITYFESGGLIERLPFVPDGLRGTMRGMLQVRRALRSTSADVCLFMTQTPVALAGRWRRRRPYVVMTDDTPVLYDGMSIHYGIPPDNNRALRAWKHRVTVAGLRGAAKIVPMSDWARRSFIDDYGIDDALIDVIPTGVDLEVWVPPAQRSPSPMRILFVGGDFERKGGAMLLEAFRRLPRGAAELHAVTRSSVGEEDGLTTHTGLEANDPALIELFTSSHVLVLASLAEAFPNVVVEASAAGLPSIVTAVGGVPEMVVHGSTGFLIEPGDVDELARCLRELLDDPRRRAAMGHAARARAEALYDGRRNSRRVVDHLLDAARGDGRPAAP